MTARTAEHVVGRPAPALRPFVTRYQGYRYAGFPAGVHAGLPSQHLMLLIAFDAPLDVGDLRDPSAPRERFEELVGGLHVEPAAIHHAGHGHGVQLDLTPLGARALLGMPAAEVTSANVPLDAVLGRRAGELREALHDAGSWQRRFAVLDTTLGRLARDDAGLPPMVARAWTGLTGAGGTVGVEELARELGYSRRHLTERFRGEIGLTPKTVQRVTRFDRARRLVAAAERPSLAYIAATCGYADHAHLTRDWHAFADASPSDWLAGEDLLLFGSHPRPS